MANEWIYRVKSNTLQKRLFTDLENGIFTDVTFLVGSTENQRDFKVHRLVLASENSELEKILSKSTSAEIEIPDVHPKGFENLVRYCYGVDFRSPVDLSTIRETCLAAEKFKAPRLKLAAENHLLGLVKSEPIIEILQASIELKMPRLKERCLEIISSRFEKVFMTEELISAPLEVMELILRLCPDHGREFKICALVTVLQWAKKHKCSEDVTYRLLSMVQEENIAYDEVISFFKPKVEQLTVNQLREVMKGLFSKEICSLKLGPFMESTDTVGNAAAVSPEVTNAKDEASEMEQDTMLQEEAVIDQAKELKDEKEVVTIAKDEASEMEQDTMLQEEAVIDQAKVLDLKVKKEAVADLKEASELKDEKEMDADDDSDSVVMENTIQHLTNHASNLVKHFLSISSQKTEARMTEEANKAVIRVSAAMEKVVDNMIDSFKKLYEATAKEQKAEIKTTVLTEPSSSIEENESEHKMDI